jgi:hypothetical protein
MACGRPARGAALREGLGPPHDLQPHLPAAPSRSPPSPSWPAAGPRATPPRNEPCDTPRSADSRSQSATGAAHITNLSQLKALLKTIAPGLTDQRGVGPVSAAQAVVSFSHLGRCPNEAAFAALAGTSPLPASSGRIVRHQLNRGVTAPLTAPSIPSP